MRNYCLIVSCTIMYQLWYQVLISLPAVLSRNYGPANEPRNKTISEYASQLKASNTIKTLKKDPLHYVFEDMKYKHEHNTL